jgi:hypothetical protein
MSRKLHDAVRAPSSPQLQPLTSVPPHPPVPHAGAKGGRRITPAGQKDMDLIAGRVTVRMPTLGFAVAAAPVAAE